MKDWDCMQQRYRIVVADDHSLIRQGLKSLVCKNPALQIVAEASDGVELLGLLREEVPDMVIVDITMPHLNGIEAVSAIRKQYPAVDILVLTMHANKQYFYQAIAAGAQGYLIKDDSDAELLAAIEAIRSGKTYISSQLFSEVTDEALTAFRQPGTVPYVILSEREKQVLKLVVQGCSSKEIGEILQLSPRTIDHHRANLLKKFKMKNTVDLVNHVVRNAVLFPEK
jgi:DNA-binding NarL/FixJ family response regulator